MPSLYVNLPHAPSGRLLPTDICTLPIWETVERPGCHGRPNAPRVGPVTCLADAVKRARKSDRLVVQRVDSDRAIWHAPPRSSRYGAGLYGTGPQRGEPTIAECIAAARRAAADLQAERPWLPA